MKQPKHFKVDRFSHHFVVSGYNSVTEKILGSFVAQYVQYAMIKRGLRWERTPTKVYATRCTVEREYRFHRGQWDEFWRHISNCGIPKDEIDVIEHSPKRGVDVNLLLETDKKPFDYQEWILNYLADPEPSRIKMVGIQPGKGKTFCAMSAVCAEAKRLVAVLKPKYLDKWVGDVCALANCTKEDVVVVRGSTALMALIERALSGGLTEKVVIISNRTLQNWISLYEEKGDKILDMGYDCCPQDLFEALGCDTRLIDEVHEDFHFNFKLDLYTHVHRSISLSATLISEFAFQEQMYQLAYPTAERFDELEYDRYIHSHAYKFSIHKPERIRTVNNGMYSHHMVEQSIMKDRRLLIDYFETIREILQKEFIDDFKSGTRAVVFCASIDMCTAAVEHFRLAYPDADIRRFVEEDPLENLMDSRVCFTTIQSGGTGHDIPGLTLVILTTAVSSSKSNIQGWGRLRNLANLKMLFYYFVCVDIPKHVQYHEQKKELLLTRSLTHTDIDTGKILGI